MAFFICTGTWHNGSRQFGRNWKTGDVIGVACDFHKRTLSFSTNGSFAKPFGVAYRNIEFAGGLSPAFTVQGGSYGTGEFKIILGGKNRMVLLILDNQVKFYVVGFQAKMIFVISGNVLNLQITIRVVYLFIQFYIIIKKEMTTKFLLVIFQYLKIL